MKLNLSTIIIVSLIIFIILMLFSNYFKSQVNELWYDRKVEDIKSKVSKAMPHLKPYIDNIKIEAGEKSYTLNKKKIKICATDENGQYYDEDLLTHVLLHEIAHVLCDEVGHTPKWAKIDDDLQTLAKDIGLISEKFNPYEHYDYCKIPAKQIKN
tara:strand:- start:270 stop:734 length:465 start_codon:yes stop_codon:yes gene_type:complete